MREGWLAFAVGAELQVMASMMEADVAAAGPKGRHDPARTAVRHGDGASTTTHQHSLPEHFIVNATDR